MQGGAALLGSQPTFEVLDEVPGECVEHALPGAGDGACTSFTVWAEQAPQGERETIVLLGNHSFYTTNS